ncbi:MAG: hypothetical protein LBH25_02850 [Fibromonadaceae bacterium]|nr:hypothetical protein [Fibromonadaceae bacterium]
MPAVFTPSKQIHVMKDSKMESKQAPIIAEKANHNATEKSYSDAYKSWIEELDEELAGMYEEGINIRDLAKHFGRTGGAIRSRIKKLGF